MKFQVLGCWGNLTQTHRTTGFLLEDHVLLDAGTIVTALDAAAQKKISDVIITHVHMDHIKELPFFVSNRLAGLEGPIRIHGMARTLSFLKRFVFNGLVWPDFSILPKMSRPAIEYRPFRVGKKLRIGDLTFIPVSVNHTVPCAGLIITHRDKAVVHTSDTGPTQTIWRVARSNKVHAVIAETSFPNRLADLANLTGHLTPMLLKYEMEKLAIPGIPVYVYHQKPDVKEQINSELMELGNPIIYLEQGHTYNF